MIWIRLLTAQVLLWPGHYYLAIEGPGAMLTPA